jgi:hypothetical protein
MDSKETNAPKEKEEKVANNIIKTRQSYPQPKPEKPSNDDIRRQLGWHLK